jgi:hypothetical protein
MGPAADDGRPDKATDVQTFQGFDGIMVKKAHSEVRWKQGRLSLRIHEDLREAIDYLATREHRQITNFIEMLLIRHAREQLSNKLTDDGERADNLPWSRRSDLYVPGAGHLPTAQPRKRRR